MLFYKSLQIDFIKIGEDSALTKIHVTLFLFSLLQGWGHLKAKGSGVPNKLREVEVKRAKGVPTGPTTVALQLATNPCCRPDSVLLRRTLGL